MKTSQYALILMLFVGIISSSCKKDAKCIDAEGPVITENINVADFHSIDMTISGDITISQGSERQIEVIGQASIIDKINTDVTNGTWKIGLDGCYTYESLKINITVPDVKKVAISGSSDVTINDFSGQNNSLQFDISGSGNIFLNEFEGIDGLDMEISGSGNIHAQEDITTLQGIDFVASGNGNFYGFENSTFNCDVLIAGTGNVRTTVRNNLNVKIKGTGNVYYKGTPSVTQKINGSGNVVDSN